MEHDKLMCADILDILFDGKNKEYGAYELRKTYNNRMTKAMLGMATICLLFFLTRILANNDNNDRNKNRLTEVKLIDIVRPKEEKVKPIPVQLPKADPPKVETRKFATLIIVKDIEVNDPPPSVYELDQTTIGLINQDGVKATDFIAPPVEHSTGIIESIKKDEEDYTKIFIKVEQEAKFPGGLEGWKKYLERNLNANVAADDGAANGKYTVKVQFIVDKEGTISNVQAMEVPAACPSCGPEAVKVIRKGPKWEPAIQNARKVAYQAVQFETFQVSEE
jgi:periplasmic protein TonB